MKIKTKKIYQTAAGDHQSFLAACSHQHPTVHFLLSKQLSAQHILDAAYLLAQQKITLRVDNCSQ